MPEPHYTLNVSSKRGLTEITFTDENKALMAWDFFLTNRREQEEAYKYAKDAGKRDKLIMASLRKGDVFMKRIMG